jgi:aquaporin Z
MRLHWRECVMEAAGLAIFMVAACGFTVLLEHPMSPARQAIPDRLARRVVMGAAMGATAIALIYSPWGRRSGAHLNPAVTLTFWRLGKVAPSDAVGYVVAQFAGGVLGVAAAAGAAGAALAHPAVGYATTVPGRAGVPAAFAAELLISFALMTVVLQLANRAALASFTGLAAGALVAAYIVVEAPLSGMSMNPARTLGSATPAGVWTGLWLYFVAPPLGMLAAAEIHQRATRSPRVRCAKLQHDSSAPCIFRCDYAEVRA